MKEPFWLEKQFLLTLNERLLSEFGGEDGIRDEGRLDSALQRPAQAYDYGTTSVIELGSMYACSIVEGRPFIDGNKRTAFVATIVFLELNGILCTASELDASMQTLGLASRQISQDEYTQWLGSYCKPIEK